jgi:hypothetical protein
MADYLDEHILAVLWMVENEITPEVIEAAAEHGLPPLPVVETVNRFDGAAWVRLCQLYGLLPPRQVPVGSPVFGGDSARELNEPPADTGNQS